MDKKGNMILQKLYPSLVIATSLIPETGEKIFMDGDFDAVSEVWWEPSKRLPR